MNKTRLEAFSDGVIAIIITIMVLELKVPHHPSWEALMPLFPTFISYLLSFILLSIYWGNHHHLLHTIKEVNSKILWSNLHLLFWLSLIPFVTAWMGENHFQEVTVALYAIVLDMCGIAYFILLRNIAKYHPNNTALAIPIKKQTRKGTISCVAYTLAIPLAFVHVGISAAIFLLVAGLWLIPDSNIEKTVKEHSH